MSVVVSSYIPAALARRAIQPGASVLGAHYSATAGAALAYLGARFRLAAHAQFEFASSDIVSTYTYTQRVAFLLDGVSDRYWCGLGCTAHASWGAGSGRTRAELTLEDLTGAAIDGTRTIYGTEMATVPDGERGLTNAGAGADTLGQNGISGYNGTGWTDTRYFEVPAASRGLPACLRVELHGVRVYSIDVIGVQTGVLG